MEKRQDKLYADIIDKGISIYWRTLAKARGMRLCCTDIEWAVSEDHNGPERIFSVHISPEDSEKRVAEIAAEIERGSLPDSLIITQSSTPGNIVDILQRKGFSIDASMPCMVMDLEGFSADIRGPGQIRTKLVDGKEELKEWISVVRNDFDVMSDEQFHDIYELPDTYLYLSLYSGVPAGCCMIIIGKAGEEEFAVLELVNTQTELQRRGIGTAMLSWVLNELINKGIRYVTLRSSEEGFRLYTKLGFKEYDKRILATFEEKTAGMPL